MLVTVGILAYNESQTIAKTIRSLFKQSVFGVLDGSLGDVTWNVIVVPNGCTDDTDAVARQALADAAANVSAVPITCYVESLERPGKSNAWNELVHRIADPGTDVFVMMDADIEYGHEDTIQNCLRRLLVDQHARVVVDLPLKDFTRKSNPTLLERFSSQMSQAKLGSPAAIAGSFYCARGATLRQVWMPVGISVEDGFLNAMVATDCFRAPPDLSRVVRAENATHYFEGLTNLRSIVQHEVRLTIGTILNCYLCWDTLLFLTSPAGPGAGPLLKSLNQSRPNWYRDMMNNQIANRRWLVLPRGMLFQRFSGWGTLPLKRRLPQLPRRTLAFLFDLLVFAIATRKLRSGNGIGYW